MHTIRLFREVNYPGDRGPSRGMYALQRALREANWPWLKIGSVLHPGEIPWVWLYRDAEMAVQLALWGWPFILGPNVLFKNSHLPGCDVNEMVLLDAASCRLQFTESEWYAALIQQHCNRNEAPIILWSYPIDPQPDGPLAAKYDLLIYLKNLGLGREAVLAQECWPNSNTVVYGKYNRDEMIRLARQSRAALYLSSDDRGPLAAAEIALAGCPLVGIERGCPWVATPGLGVRLVHFGAPELWEACEQAVMMNRDLVRATALEHFSTNKTVKIIHDALEPIAMGEQSCGG